MFDIFRTVKSAAKIDPNAVARTLVTSERAPTGNFSVVECQAYLATRDAGGVETVFSAVDDDGVEVFAREDDGPWWAEKMALAPGTVPTPDEVCAWISAKASAVFAEWEPRLSEAWLEAEKVASERAKRR